jgi:hypothetical protein
MTTGSLLIHVANDENPDSWTANLELFELAHNHAVEREGHINGTAQQHYELHRLVSVRTLNALEDLWKVQRLGRPIHSLCVVSDTPMIVRLAMWQGGLEKKQQV